MKVIGSGTCKCDVAVISTWQTLASLPCGPSRAVAPYRPTPNLWRCVTTIGPHLDCVTLYILLGTFFRSRKEGAPAFMNEPLHSFALER